jgi:hypothetical protein
MKRILCLIALAVIMVPALPAQQIKEIEFKNQAITDILLALGGLTDDVANAFVARGNLRID